MRQTVRTLRPRSPRRSSSSRSRKMTTRARPTRRPFSRRGLPRQTCPRKSKHIVVQRMAGALRIRECTTSLKPRRHGAACSRCMEKLWSEHRRLFAALVILRRSLPDIRQYARTAMRANRFRIPRRGARANPSNQLASSAPQYTAQVCRSWSPAQENACRPRRHPMHLAGRIAE